MSYDGLFAGVIAHELNHIVDGRAKIEKIHQPESDVLIVQLNTRQGRKRLLISAQAGGASVYLTERSFDNPPSAPPFCMLLRKHILGGRITEVRQPGTERVIEFSIDTVNEMGYTHTKRLVAEVMGKHSNIILIDAGTDKIVDCIKHVSIDVNRYRQLLPGLPYVPPPSQDKLDAWTAAKEDIAQRLTEADRPGPHAVMDAVSGIGPTLAEEVWLSGPPDSAAERILHVRDSLAEPTAIKPEVYVNERGDPQDVHVFPLRHVFPSERTMGFDQTGQALDYFYSNRLQSNRVFQRSESLRRRVQAVLDKLLLKKQRLLEELESARNSEPLRLKAELLTANLHAVTKGETTVSVLNYYDGTTAEIELDPRYSPSKNAQNYYKLYRKAQTAAREKQRQLNETERELKYIESILSSVALASDDETLVQIRIELAEGGYVRTKKRAKQKRQKPKPNRCLTAGGFDVYIGRSNTENDYLTFSLAGKNDLWFHAKDIPGSHVVLRTGGSEPRNEDILEAARLAAAHSKASDSDNVPVDYTQIRHVRKPAGAKPGMVIYDSQKTLYVTPERNKQ